MTSSDDASVRPVSVSIGGRACSVLRGGAGPSLVLIHGGWGGAALHWSTVLEPLAAHFDVIAPDLPGFAAGESVAPRGVADDAAWLASVLDALGVRVAWMTGNSYGGSVAAAFASRYPERCLGVVFVNGFPMPKTPAVLKHLARLPFARTLLRRQIREDAFAPARLLEAFHDARNVPPALRGLLEATTNAPLDRLVDTFVLGGSELRLADVPIAILWGADDRLKATRGSAAEDFARSLPGATLVRIPDAGHCPQLEQPAAFVAALVAFVTAAPPASSPV